MAESVKDKAPKKATSFFNPFPGLRPFSIDESHLFFGREGQSDEILESLAENRFVAVLGASGSGKSSLMYCGLVPILYGGFLTKAGSRWKMIKTRPGGGPIKNLADAIVDSAKEETDKDQKILNRAITTNLLKSGSLGLVEAIRQQTLTKNENILVMVDQFEELFRFKKSRDDNSAINESEAFIKLLVEAANQSEVPIYIVLTMRSDFIGDCSQFQDLTKLINNSNYLIPKMTRNDFREAIMGPVAVGGGKMEPHLVQQLLNDVGDNPDQLPILQHALMRTWNYWADNRNEGESMSIEHYEAIGKMEKALSEHANEAFDELNEDERRICETMFKTLTEKGGDNRGTRHPTRLDVLSKICKAEESQVTHVIDIFKGSGRSFVSASTVVIKSDSIIDISHESLMRIWDRLKAWVEEEASAVQMYLRLSDASEMYQKGKTGLWRPPDLHLATAWNSKQQPTLTWAERHNPAYERTMVFLETSEKEFIAEEQNKIRLQKRALQRSRIVAIILGSATVISLGVGLWAYTQSIEAQKQKHLADIKSEEALEASKLAEAEKKNAQAAQILAEEQKKQAELAQIEAIAQKEEAEKQKEFALIQQREALRQKEFATKKSKEAEEQKALAEISATEAKQQTALAEEASDNAYKLRMLSISQSMAVKSQQMNKDTTKKALIAYQAYLFNDKYGGDKHNPDIYAGLYSTLKKLNSDTYNNLEGHDEAVRSLAYDKNGSLYSAGSDGKILKWDGKDNEKNFSIITENKFINRTLSVSDDGKWLACGTEDATIQLFDLNNVSSPARELKGHTDVVWSIKFTPDNKNIISSSADSTILIWDLEKLNSIVVAKSKSRVRSIAISPDGRYIVGGTEDGNIILWDRQNNNTSEILTSEKNPAIQVVTFNHDGTQLASGDIQGGVKLWNMETKKVEFTLGGHHARINDIKFSPADDMLATASFDGVVQLWQTANYNNQPIVLNDHDSWVWAIEFSPDGETLITGCVDKQIKEWPTNADKMA
ncbi:MAG: hypothetical protein COB85_04230, partial [Bacteroidetes bacterium]